MMMMKSVSWWRKPEYPEETTDHCGLRLGNQRCGLGGTVFESPPGGLRLGNQRCRLGGTVFDYPPVV